MKTYLGLAEGTATEERAGTRFVHSWWQGYGSCGHADICHALIPARLGVGERLMEARRRLEGEPCSACRRAVPA